MKKIVLTGGGTAGHVTPNLALIPELQNRNYEILYVGSYNGIEKELLEKAGIPYMGISSGKLRRYFSLKNFSDPFRIQKGLLQAIKILKDFNPDIVFSKGGFVSVPVVLAAKHLHIPAIIHESDMTPGLANKLCIPSASKICCNFPETLNYLPKEKAVLTGSPIRRELLSGSKEEGYRFTGFTADKPVLLVIGGSLGSVKVNQAIRGILPELLKSWQVIHLCGKGNLDSSLNNLCGYRQYEYISSQLKDLFAISELMISRAGANSICEILALRKPNLLIPLSAAASRGDQILNANSFQKQGFSEVLQEEELNDASLLRMIEKIYANRKTYIQAMNHSDASDAIETIIQLIEEISGV